MCQPGACYICRKEGRKEGRKEERKEGIVLFNDALNTFYLWLHDIGCMVKDHLAREQTHGRNYMSYSFRLAARILLYTPFHRQDSTYHSLSYTSHGALDGMRIAQCLHHEGLIQQPISL